MRSDRVERGQRAAREFFGQTRVDGRADERFQITVTAVGAFGRGGQPEAVGRDGIFRDDARERGGQMMHLVEHEQRETVAQLLGLGGGGNVRGYEQRSIEVA